MDLSSIEIRSGSLRDVLGPVASHQGFTFIPADVDVSGFENGPKLADAMTNVEAVVRALVRPGEDAPWASGRIQKLFQLPQTPEEDRGEKCCMWFPFLAVIVEGKSAVGIPFFCTDYYGASELLFAGDPPPEHETMQQIGLAFWSLLLQNPTDLVDYTDRMEHLGAGVTIKFGVADGEPFMRGIED